MGNPKKVGEKDLFTLVGQKQPNGQLWVRKQFESRFQKTHEPHVTRVRLN